MYKTVWCLFVSKYIQPPYFIFLLLIALIYVDCAGDCFPEKKSGQAVPRNDEHFLIVRDCVPRNTNVIFKELFWVPKINHSQ